MSRDDGAVATGAPSPFRPAALSCLQIPADLWVVTFLVPAGNTVGVWPLGPRDT